MTTTDITRFEGVYAMEVTPLKGRSTRSDVHVTTTPQPATAFGATDIINVFRQFFERLEAESAERGDDPIAQTHALALLEALLADVRYVRDTVRARSAEALSAHEIRRLVIEGVIAVEASATADRTNWQHERLFAKMLDHWGVRFIADTGEVVPYDVAAARMLEWFRPDWRLTPIRESNLNPDDYCDLPKDEDGSTLRTPTVTIKDNRVRQITTTKETK